MITLDSNNSDQVSSARVIEATLGEANRKMMIFSGIALPAWIVNADDHIYHETATVNLRRTILAVEQATLSIGLASIGNDDTTFLFATDNARLDIDPVSQELLLIVDMALEGEKTSLGRFGYQVVTIVTTQTTGISGTIRWNQSVFDASNITPGQIAQMFQITANEVQHIAPPGGFAFDKYTPVAWGVTTGFSKDHEDFVVPYQIPGAPYNKPLIVNVDVGTLFRTSFPALAGQVAGPRPVILSITTPGVTGVDFRIVLNVVK